MTSLLEQYTDACNYPGVIDEAAVEAALMRYCAALGVERKIIRMRSGWSLDGTPALKSYVSLILDDAAKRGGWAARAAIDAHDASDASAASAARAALDARAAIDARDALDARAARAASAASDAIDARAAFDARAARDASDARDARAASAARDALDASAALDARAARDASAAFMKRFASWCVHRAGWWWVGDLSWLATTHVGASQLTKDSVTIWSAPVFEAYLAGCWMVCWTPDALLWVAKPRVHVEKNENWRGRRLHRADGPAVESDLENLYFWHGVLVPAYVVTRPEWITVDEIERERNAELRRVLIERYKGGRDKDGGAAAYLRDSGAVVVHEDTDLLGAPRRLLRKDVPGDEPILMIDVRNSTQEPDGSWKQYQLRVDPNAYDGRAGRECIAAIASTWRDADGSMLFERPEDYQPGVET